MPFQIFAARNLQLEGTINVAVMGDPNVPSMIVRVDGALPEQPVRNFDNTGSDGREMVADAEAPLGRPVVYRLKDVYDNTLATSNSVTLVPPLSGKSLIRLVLRPSINMWVEPQDQTALEWSTTTTVHTIVNSDTPVIVGEVRQRHNGVIQFLCKSIAEADELVLLMRDGTPILLRHSPCAGQSVRDMLFYAKNVTERLVDKGPWRTIIVEFQTTRFVPGWTDEPLFSVGWNFEALTASGEDFANFVLMWPNFYFMSVVPYPPGPPWPATRDDAERHLGKGVWESAPAGPL